MSCRCLLCVLTYLGHLCLHSTFPPGTRRLYCCHLSLLSSLRVAATIRAVLGIFITCTFLYTKQIAKAIRVILIVSAGAIQNMPEFNAGKLNNLTN